MPEDLKSTEMNTSNENDESEGRDPKINYASPNLLRAHLNGKGELIVPSAGATMTTTMSTNARSDR